MSAEISRLDGEGYDGVEGRVVLYDIGTTEAYLPEIEQFIELPLRVTHSAWGGVELELGPYVFTGSSVGGLPLAIAAYKDARQT
jgi:hypothetical protein